MDTIKNIIFDYGNVIFLIDFKLTQHSFAGLGIGNVECFFAHTGHDPLFDRFEKGEISSAEFRAGIRKITGISVLSDERIDSAWNALLLGVPPVNHEILLKAKQKYRTFLLSNINEIHYQWVMSYLKNEYNLESNDGFFEKAYYSHLLGMRKPDTDIFNHVLTDSRLKPGETLFIDDSPQHLSTARDLGLHTHLMAPGDSLENYMQRSGLLDD